MYCHNHPEVAAVGSCTSCGKLICNNCAVDVQGKIVCRDCVSEGKAVRGRTEHDPNTVFLVEFIGGFFGLLGIGYFLVGRTNEGLIRVIAWIIYDIIAVVTITLLATVLIGFLCIPFQLAIQIGVPYWSASTLKKELLAQV